MRERAESVGAELVMSSSMGEGTTVTLRIPQVGEQGGTP
jgi:signal transduction histidine kinase